MISSSRFVAANLVARIVARQEGMRLVHVERRLGPDCLRGA
jgi:hypothetical protein